MTFTIPLDLLSQNLFAFLCVFARFGTGIMVLPGFGSSVVSSRVRLLIALAIGAVATPVVASSYPAVPGQPIALAFIVISEIIVGAAIGLTGRLIMTALQVAGTIIAFQTGLAFAQNFDPSQDVQGALTGTFLSMIAVTLIFVMDLHHLMIGALMDSYTLFPPATALPLDRFVSLAVDLVAGSFVLGIQLSAPFLVVGLIFYLGIGVLSKLMPQVQIFFIAMPANIMLGFIIMFLTLSAMMMWFTDYFVRQFSNFLV